MDIVNFLDNIETAAATDEQQKELDEFKEAALLKYRADNPDTAESEMALYEEELNYKARQILLKQFVLKSLSEYSTDVTFKVLSVGNNVVLQVDDTEKNYVIAIGKYSTYSEEAIEALSASVLTQSYVPERYTYINFKSKNKNTENYRVNLSPLFEHGTIREHIKHSAGLDTAINLGAKLTKMINRSLAEGVVFPDFKPGNVGVTDKGDVFFLDTKSLIKVDDPADFSSKDFFKNDEDQLLETKGYMPADFHPRPDKPYNLVVMQKFQLALTLYSMATGIKPSQSNSDTYFSYQGRRTWVTSMNFDLDVFKNNDEGRELKFIIQSLAKDTFVSAQNLELEDLQERLALKLKSINRLRSDMDQNAEGTTEKIQRFQMQADELEININEVIRKIDELVPLPNMTLAEADKQISYLLRTHTEKTVNFDKVRDYLNNFDMADAYHNVKAHNKNNKRVKKNLNHFLNIINHQYPYPLRFLIRLSDTQKAFLRSEKVLKALQQFTREFDEQTKIIGEEKQRLQSILKTLMYDNNEFDLIAQQDDPLINLRHRILQNVKAQLVELEQIQKSQAKNQIKLAQCQQWLKDECCHKFMQKHIQETLEKLNTQAGIYDHLLRTQAASIGLNALKRKLESAQKTLELLQTCFPKHIEELSNPASVKFKYLAQLNALQADLEKLISTFAQQIYLISLNRKSIEEKTPAVISEADLRIESLHSLQPSLFAKNQRLESAAEEYQTISRNKGEILLANIKPTQNNGCTFIASDSHANNNASIEYITRNLKDDNYVVTGTNKKLVRKACIWLSSLGKNVLIEKNGTSKKYIPSIAETIEIRNKRAALKSNAKKPTLRIDVEEHRDALLKQPATTTIPRMSI